MRRVILAALLALAAGCYDTPKPACAFRCGPAGECPTDYQCGLDGQCHLLQNGSLAECPALPMPDAADETPDADVSAPDAPVSTPDARTSDS